ncbi:golgin subfamily A member 6-like protein 22 [Paramacrobiotus metropolitanus]|uniref:golgin subfamily A member 6-like protein 22 n=1 Tax=Paramacrobiotus metropolitanus TaxID=2943436 RepID=UPI002445CA3D|nr:golgin subfamily A member 6-like protein 22 [Paramacrobiotus metropolitanus]
MVTDGENKDDLKAETGGMARSAEKVKEDQTEKGNTEVSQKVTEGGGAVSSDMLIDEGKVKQDDLSDNSLFLQEQLEENGNSPMSSDKFYTDDEDETTIRTSFHTALKEASITKEMFETTAQDRLEETFEGTASGKADDRDQRSPSPKTSVLNGLKQRVKELERLLDEKEEQAFAAIRDQRNKTFEAEARLSVTEDEVQHWKVKFEVQKQAAEDLKKMVEDRDTRGTLTDEDNDLSEEVAERSREIAELKRERDLLQLKVKEVEKKRDESLSNATKFTGKITSLTADNSKLKDELKSLEENNKTLQTELQDTRKKRHEAESQREHVAKELLELAEKTKTEFKRLNDEVENQKKEAKKWLKQAQLCDERVTVLEVANGEGRKENEKQKAEIIKLSDELVELATIVMEKDDKIKELEKVKEECEARERTLADRADRITRLEAEAEILKAAKMDLDKTLDNRASTILEQMRKVTEANNDYEKLRKDANETVKQLQQTVKQREEEIKTLKRSAKQKEGEAKQPERIESPPPGYGEVHTVEGSFHFQAPLKTGTGRSDGRDEDKVKAEKVTDDTELAKGHSGPIGGVNPRQQETGPRETIVYKSDHQPDNHEDPRVRQNEQERVAREEERREREHRAEYHAEAQRLRREEREFRGIMRAMSRKSALIDFNGNREALLGWIRQVKETQKTYDLSDAAMMLEVANAVKGTRRLGLMRKEKSTMRKRQTN